MTTPSDPADPNPYVAPEVSERVTEPSRRSRPGPFAIYFSVLGALVVAVIVFAATFFVTCLGMVSSDVDSNSEFGKKYGTLLLIWIPAITAIAAFVFTLWGILKLVRAFKEKRRIRGEHIREAN